jgi:hypothetical protein
MVKSFRTSHLQITNRLEPLSHNETREYKKCRWNPPTRNFKCRNIYCILSMYNNRVWLFKSCGKLLKVLNSVWSFFFLNRKKVLGTYANLMSLVRNSYVAFRRIVYRKSSNSIVFWTHKKPYYRKSVLLEDFLWYKLVNQGFKKSKVHFFHEM